MNNKIGIITVTYNSSNHIEKFLRSLIKEKAFIAEIIVVENSSHDKSETERITRNFIKANKEPKITFISNSRNLGFAKSCNQGANRCKGDYLLFINPDTELTKDSLKILLSHADENKADLIGGRVNKYSQERHNTVVRKPDLKIGLFEFSNMGKVFKIHSGHNKFYYQETPNIYNAKKDVLVDALGGAYLMTKKSSFEKLKGFDERFFMYLEDVDLGVRANHMDMKVIYCPHSIIKHEGGASSNNKYKIRHQAWYDSRKEYYKKHFGLLANLIIQPLYTVEEYLLKLRDKRKSQ